MIDGHGRFVGIIGTAREISDAATAHRKLNPRERDRARETAAGYVVRRAETAELDKIKNHVPPYTFGDRPAPVRIQRKRIKGWLLPPEAVVVDRSSRWGNPFRVGADHNGRKITPGEAVTLYQEALLAGTLKNITVTQVRRELAGRDLACWCPLADAEGNRVPCHADVLIEIANTESEDTPRRTP